MERLGSFASSQPSTERPSNNNSDSRRYTSYNNYNYKHAYASKLLSGNKDSNLAMCWDASQAVCLEAYDYAEPKVLRLQDGLEKLDLKGPRCGPPNKARYDRQKRYGSSSTGTNSLKKNNSKHSSSTNSKRKKAKKTKSSSHHRSFSSDASSSPSTQSTGDSTIDTAVTRDSSPANSSGSHSGNYRRSRHRGRSPTQRSHSVNAASNSSSHGQKERRNASLTAVPRVNPDDYMEATFSTKRQSKTNKDEKEDSQGTAMLPNAAPDLDRATMASPAVAHILEDTDDDANEKASPHNNNNMLMRGSFRMTTSFDSNNSQKTGAMETVRRGNLQQHSSNDADKNNNPIAISSSFGSSMQFFVGFSEATKSQNQWPHHVNANVNTDTMLPDEKMNGSTTPPPPPPPPPTYQQQSKTKHGADNKVPPYVPALSSLPDNTTAEVTTGDNMPDPPRISPRASPTLSQQQKHRNIGKDVAIVVGQGKDQQIFYYNSHVLLYISDYFSQVMAPTTSNKDRDDLTAANDSAISSLGNTTSSSATSANAKTKSWQIDFTHKTVQDWKTFYPFLEPPVKRTVSLDIHNLPVLLPWFHEFKLPLLLHQCDCMLAGLHFRSVQQGATEQDLQDALLLLYAALSCDLPQSQELGIHVIAEYLEQGPHLFHTTSSIKRLIILLQCFPHFQSRLWESAIEAYLPSDLLILCQCHTARHIDDGEGNDGTSPSRRRHGMDSPYNRDALLQNPLLTYLLREGFAKASASARTKRILRDKDRTQGTTTAGRSSHISRLQEKIKKRGANLGDHSHATNSGNDGSSQQSEGQNSLGSNSILAQSAGTDGSCSTRDSSKYQRRQRHACNQGSHQEPMLEEETGGLLEMELFLGGQFWGMGWNEEPRLSQEKEQRQNDRHLWLEEIVERLKAYALQEHHKESQLEHEGRRQQPTWIRSQAHNEYSLRNALQTQSLQPRNQREHPVSQQYKKYTNQSQASSQSHSSGGSTHSGGRREKDNPVSTPTTDTESKYIDTSEESTLSSSQHISSQICRVHFLSTTNQTDNGLAKSTSLPDDDSKVKMPMRGSNHFPRRHSGTSRLAETHSKISLKESWNVSRSPAVYSNGTSHDTSATETPTSWRSATTKTPHEGDSGSPADAFWSLLLQDEEEMFLENEI